MPARFREQARRYADRIAVATRAGSLTYAELDRAATLVANAVLDHAGHAERPVALLFPHGGGAIVAMLGVLSAGRCYVFLDPSLPRTRLALLIDDSLCSAVVTDAAGLALARELKTGADVIDIGELRAGAARLPDGEPRPEIGPDSLFNLIYTSGSTGQPKGVLNNHRNVLDTVAKYSYNLQICPEDRVAQLAGGSFNTSVMSIFGALLNGAAVHPFDLRADGASRLSAWLREERITLYHSVPTAYRQLLDAIGDERFPDLRAVCLGGEAVYRRDVDRHRARLGPHVPLVHGLGCTELSMIRQLFVDGETPLPESRVPAGYPIPEREVLLLDGDGRPVAPGETGEIVLRSRHLALGYWRRPDLTDEAFTPDPSGGSRRLYRTGDLGVVTADGCLTHLGRQDFQVKIRGHRIETAEVELALLELPNVREAVVTARAGRAGEPELVAYVVPGSAPAPPADELRAELAARLPDYMMPSAFVALAALPLTETGKVDRLALPAPGRARPLSSPPASPRTAVERALAEIWQDVLELDAVGIHDDFLLLGGDSLLASKILARVERAFGVELQPSALLRAATIAEMAAHLPAPAVGAPPARAGRSTTAC